jgi:hypothetical protein
MLMALALLAVVEAASPPRVEVTLTGAAGAPVSAAPRGLSDVARELREGRKAVGGFSAVETTVPRSLRVGIPTFDWEDEPAAAEPEVVTQPGPAYVTTFVPAGYGGGTTRRAVRRRSASLAVPGPGLHTVVRPSASPVFPSRPAATGRSRRQL